MTEQEEIAQLKKLIYKLAILTRFHEDELLDDDEDHVGAFGPTAWLYQSILADANNRPTADEWALQNRLTRA